MHEVSDPAAVAQLRSYIADHGLAAGDRLPPERQLGPELGLRRSSLRRALEILVHDGVLWRHVGKGTFLADDRALAANDSLSAVARDISPADAMRARAAFEPSIAREAALHASAADISRLELIADRARHAATWREYDSLDADLHRAIAEATASPTLLALFDQLNALRAMISWGKARRTGPRPPDNHLSFAEHDRIIEAIAARIPDEAEEAMRRHLQTVSTRLEA
ncbi:FadR family transcriptional regulator [Aestuariicoccus sp. KMU-90]|uniref:FadR family transcriptional regulator n=1 Tax=Thetidibacter halocola TaxID=2827239 RepID=A0A8J8B561_9RHOB|nr:FadR family transcriptional regulator [Thetidibacter halocola]